MALKIAVNQTCFDDTFSTFLYSAVACSLNEYYLAFIKFLLRRERLVIFDEIECKVPTCNFLLSATVALKSKLNLL